MDDKIVPRDERMRQYRQWERERAAKARAALPVLSKTTEMGDFWAWKCDSCKRVIALKNDKLPEPCHMPSCRGDLHTKIGEATTKGEALDLGRKS